MQMASIAHEHVFGLPIPDASVQATEIGVDPVVQFRGARREVAARKRPGDHQLGSGIAVASPVDGLVTTHEKSFGTTPRRRCHNV